MPKPFLLPLLVLPIADANLLEEPLEGVDELEGVEVALLPRPKVGVGVAEELCPAVEWLLLWGEGVVVRVGVEE
jgi:hypothetical protein